MIQIDSHIPAPAKATRANARYQFDKLKIGDSFAVHAKPSNVKAAIHGWVRRANVDHKHIVDVDPVDTSKVRVWRVA